MQRLYAYLILSVVCFFTSLVLAERFGSPMGGRLDPCSMFLLILVAVLAIVQALYLLRYSPPWEAAPPKPENHETLIRTKTLPDDSASPRRFFFYYFSPVDAKDRRPSELVVWIPLDVSGTFVVGRENAFDTFCKRLGLANEIESGDAAFDAFVYIRSDHVKLVRAFFRDPQRRRTATALLKTGFPEIGLGDRLLFARWRGFTTSERGLRAITEEAAELLHELSVGTEALTEETFRKAGGSRWNRRLVPLLLTTVGLFGLLWVLQFRYPVVNQTSLLLWSFVPMLVLLFGVGWLCARLLHGFAKSHYRWAQVLIPALTTIPMGCIGLVSFLNGALDRSPAVVRESVVTGVITTTSRSRHVTTYFVRHRPWDGGWERTMKIPPDVAGRIRVGETKVRVVTHEGFFGMEWMESAAVP